MKRYFILVIFLMVFGTPYCLAQISAGILAYPHISKDQIVFTYADDLWLVSRKGGTAQKLSTPPGTEMFARFSPDGRDIVFSGNYNGAVNLYRIPSEGGVPFLLTNHSMADIMLNWYPDGNHILFASDRESGNNRFSQLYKIHKDGGMAQKLSIPYGEFGCLSPDGKRIAFTTKSTIMSTWKRYRGGLAADIYVFDPETLESVNITDHEATDELPMWHGTTIYFLSDRGPENRLNLWSYDMNMRMFRQVTSFTDRDVRFPSLGADAIVFTAGTQMYVYDVLNGSLTDINVQVITDMTAKMPRQENVASYLQRVSLAPDGNRILVEARGEIFSVPVEHGYVKNLTQSSGNAERYPEWSPDGRHVAWFTDRRGEYELALHDVTNGKETVLTALGPGYRYQPWWSPDSKKVVFIDQTMSIQIHDIPSGKTQKIDQQRFAFHGSLEGFTVSWSPDSRWIAYAKDISGRGQAIAIYDTKNDTFHQVTSGYYNDQSPCFDPKGKYLYFTSNRAFNPVYSDFDNSWTYPNATQIAMLNLQQDSLSPLAARNDTVAIKTEKNQPEKEIKKSKKVKGTKEEAPDETDAIPAVQIDFADMERRVILLPVKAGNFGALHALEDKLIFIQRPPAGSESQLGDLKIWDRTTREEKTIISGINGYQVSANDQKIIVQSEAGFFVIKPEPDQKAEKPVNIGELYMKLFPADEWQQIFLDVWRFQRDYFYDKEMHGVDWRKMKSVYWDLVLACATRSDLNFVIGELIGELNASHTYRAGGDIPTAPTRPIGYLGINWGVRDGKFIATRILRGGPWDAEVRSPLDQSGIKYKEGDYILAVNGTPLGTEREPYAAFSGLAGKTVELTIAPAENPALTQKIIVELLSDEYRLRHLDWIEQNRQYVEKGSNGKVGYVYVTNTGVEGQSELLRQFMGQRHKEALLIDERWNSGGQIPDRFIELLNRKPLAYWAVRDGETWQWPPVAHFGPKAMLINGWSGSGGDAFPDYFRKSDLGPLIGTRTWGGLIGISGSPTLIDNGFVTVPTFRMYNPDGTWFLEGHGVDPDYEVPEQPGPIARGADPQIDRALLYLMEQLQNKPIVVPPRPAAEKR